MARSLRTLIAVVVLIGGLIFAGHGPAFPHSAESFMINQTAGPSALSDLASNLAARRLADLPLRSARVSTILQIDSRKRFHDAIGAVEVFDELVRKTEKLALETIPLEQTTQKRPMWSVS